MRIQCEVFQLLSPRAATRKKEKKKQCHCGKQWRALHEANASEGHHDRSESKCYDRGIPRATDCAMGHCTMRINRKLSLIRDFAHGIFRLGVYLCAMCTLAKPLAHISTAQELYEGRLYIARLSTLGGELARVVCRRYGVTCNASNWFNEECRGFTQCGMSSMNAVSNRPDAAAVCDACACSKHKKSL